MYDKDWKRSTLGGRPVPRLPRTPLPCRRCPKSKDGSPNPGAELSAKNRRAYAYYRSCLVDPTSLLPRDLLVLHNHMICRLIEERLASVQQEAALAHTMLGALGGRRQ